MIRQGRVSVNGQIAGLGQTIDPDRDRLELDENSIEPPGRRIYLVLHKPRGFLTTVRDPQGRPTVMDLLPSGDHRLYPVGRLDRDTEGLLLLTNDGPLAHALLHPSRGVAKVYRALPRGRVSEDALRRLEQGVELEDGLTRPCRVSRCPGGWLELELKEGRKRQVRRMLAAVGNPVRQLRRIRFGPLELGRLEPGQCRELRPDEVVKLRRSTGENL